MTVFDLLIALATMAFLQVVWLLIFRSRKAPLGYLVFQRDELGRWSWHWKAGD